MSNKEHKKLYKILTHMDRQKLEQMVYFEINHEGWEPLGGVQVIPKGSELLWVQTLWLPKPYWPVLTEGGSPEVKATSELMG